MIDIAKIKEFFELNNFQVETDHMIPNAGHTAELYAQRKGRSMLILPWIDAIYFHDFDHKTSHVDNLKKLHEAARAEINSQFMLPKAFRLSTPNIITVAVSEQGFSDEMKEYAQQPTATMIGGEFHSVSLIDLKNKLYISQGTSLTYIANTGFTIPGQRKIEFKNINPQNRTYYLINTLAEGLFKMYTG